MGDKNEIVLIESPILAFLLQLTLLLSTLQWWFLRSTAQDLALWERLVTGVNLHMCFIGSVFIRCVWSKTRSTKEEIGCDLKVALYLAQLLSNSACQVAQCAAAPLTLPARWTSAWSGELLPGLLLKHPPLNLTHTQSKSSITVPVSNRAINTPPSDSMHTCDGRPKKRRRWGRGGHQG